MPHRTRAAVISLSLLLAAPSLADEGMWLPEQLSDLAEVLRARGLELDPAQLGDLDAAPLNAVVSLGGCSASFVSPEGLVITNHHCAVGALQHNSTAERNLFDDGFYAETLADEVWAGPGSRVYVTVGMTDVTDDVLDGIPAAADDMQRYEAIDGVRKELVAACEATPGYRCEVVRFYAGASYRLIRRLEIQDVRLVYAPAGGIGFFGGDDDNWMWPRHTGDWSFLRAYVAPDGSGAPYDPENVPYRPDSHLELRTSDLDPGDFVMVAGYPGGTYRFRTGSEMAWARDELYPRNVAAMNDIIGILDAVGARDPEAEVRLGSLRFGLANYKKNNEGMLDSFRAGGAVERAVARDAALRATLAARTDADAQRWLAAFDELEQVLAEDRVDATRERWLSWLEWSVNVVGVASTSHWLAVERELPDMERERGYQERDWPEIREDVARMDTSFVADADAALLAYMMRQLDALGDAEVDALVQRFLAMGRSEGDAAGAAEGDPSASGDPFDAAARAVLSQTLLVDGAERMRLLDAALTDVVYARDPAVQLAVGLYPLQRAIRDREKAREGALTRLRPLVLEAVRALSDAPVYPDANSTLRVTFGVIRGYAGPDGVEYLPFTTVQGVRAKHTGAEPFDAPQPLVDAIDAGDWGRHIDPDLGTVPVNFLSTLDTTGGNSGSATLDSQGRLCGLLFDGNYESMASDWLFDPAKTRSIHVGTQYILWVMEHVDHTTRLLDELRIAR